MIFPGEYHHGCCLGYKGEVGYNDDLNYFKWVKFSAAIPCNSLIEEWHITYIPSEG